VGLRSLVNSGVLEVWPDLYDARMDDLAAPDLADVADERKGFYSNPDEFFRRTHLTRNMRDMLEDVAKSVAGGVGGLTS